MRTTLRRIVSLCTRAGLGIAAAAAVLVTPAPVAAQAQATVFLIANGASSLSGPVPRGALLTIVTDAPVSAEVHREFTPWAEEVPDGLYVSASCDTYDDLVRLPILYVGASNQSGGTGTRINVYYPNSGDPQSCADGGLSSVRVHPAEGYGAAVVQDVVTVASHPGIFSIVIDGVTAPDGDHVNVGGGTTTPLFACNRDLPAYPQRCPTRTQGSPARLTVRLTGADGLTCADEQSCGSGPLTFRLAPVAGDGGVGTYVPQDLLSVAAQSTGVQVATIRLTVTTASTYLLRVVYAQAADLPDPVPVEFGTPT